MEGDSYALDDPAMESDNVYVLTYFDEEGRRIYERTLQFVFIAACNRVLPKKRVRIEHSFGNALYVNLPGTVVTWSLVNAIEKEMHSIVDADMPIEFTETTREEALKYYEQVGELDKLRLRASSALLSGRRDVIVVSSVSCIYGIGHAGGRGFKSLLGRHTCPH